MGGFDQRIPPPYKRTNYIIKTLDAETEETVRRSNHGRYLGSASTQSKSHPNKQRPNLLENQLPLQNHRSQWHDIATTRTSSTKTQRIVLPQSTQPQYTILAKTTMPQTNSLETVEGDNTMDVC